MNSKIRNELRQIAASMPIVMRHTSEKQIMTGEELLQDEIYEVEGEKVDPAKTYVFHAPVQIAINHYRKLKKMYKKHGIPGIKMYCTEIYRIEKSASA